MRKRTTLFKQAKEKEDIKISKLCPISPCTTAGEIVSVTNLLYVVNNNVSCVGEYQEIQNPKLRIAQRASILSDISVEDAHTIDDYNLYKALGEFNIGLISEKFHSKCINDKDEWFRSMFQYSPLDDIISTFSEYLMQRFGGPQYYTDNKGIDSLSSSRTSLISFLITQLLRNAEPGPGAQRD